MSEARLADIRAEFEWLSRQFDPGRREHAVCEAGMALLAEVERQRAREAAQEARETALLAVVQKLIRDADSTYVEVHPYAGIGHTKIVGPFPETLEQARALLASTERRSGGDGG